jgi:hypothetical protein
MRDSTQEDKMAGNVARTWEMDLDTRKEEVTLETQD